MCVSSRVGAGGGSAWRSPGLVLAIVVVVTLGILAVGEVLHCAGDGVLLGWLLFGGLLLVKAFVILDLLCVERPVHEQIDHDFPRLVAGDLSHELLDLAGQEPVHVGDGEAGLVVGRDGNIDPVERRVRVAESDDGDVHVGGLSEGLVVKAGIADNDESWLEVPVLLNIN